MRVCDKTHTVTQNKCSTLSLRQRLNGKNKMHRVRLHKISYCTILMSGRLLDTSRASTPLLGSTVPFLTRVMCRNEGTPTYRFLPYLVRWIETKERQLFGSSQRARGFESRSYDALELPTYEGDFARVRRLLQHTRRTFTRDNKNTSALQTLYK